MKITIYLATDCEEYNTQHNEGVLKTSLFPSKNFSIVKGEYGNDKFWINNSHCYNCVFFERLNKVHVFID